MSALSGLDAVTDAVETGAGLPSVVRAAAEALHASLAAVDASGNVVAVAARSPAEERGLIAGGAGVETVELRVADAVVGTLRMRPHSGGAVPGGRTPVSPSLLRLVATVLAFEVERVRAPQLASESAVGEFLRGLLAGTLTGRERILVAARELPLEVEAGASVILARARTQRPVEDGWRMRVRTVAERGARAAARGTVAALSERVGVAAAEVIVLVPGGDEVAARAAEGALREMAAALPGCAFTLGRSRVAADPGDLPRAAKEALLAANVAAGEEAPGVLAFEDTGAYRLLLSTMSANPSELERFYAETVEPLVAYDEQYDTELVRTLQTFLEADGNVAGSAQRLFTHRHTVYYRLERIRELTGLDVGSTDGREKLSLGLKSMRVLGLSTAAGPASEARASGGRVPRGSGSDE